MSLVATLLSASFVAAVAPAAAQEPIDDAPHWRWEEPWRVEPPPESGSPVDDTFDARWEEAWRRGPSSDVREPVHETRYSRPDEPGRLDRIPEPPTRSAAPTASVWGGASAMQTRTGGPWFWAPRRERAEEAAESTAGRVLLETLGYALGVVAVVGVAALMGDIDLCNAACEIGPGVVLGSAVLLPPLGVHLAGESMGGHGGFWWTVLGHLLTLGLPFGSILAYEISSADYVEELRSPTVAASWTWR